MTNGGNFQLRERTRSEEKMGEEIRVIHINLDHF